MANVTQLNYTTDSDFSLSPSQRRQIWDRYVQQGVRERELLSMFEGPEGSDKAIWTKDDLSKGHGNQINFTTSAPPVGDGVRGATLLRGSEEKRNINTYTLNIELVRHAIAEDERFQTFRGAEDQMTVADGEIQWMALKKQEEALLRLVKHGVYSTSGKANNLLWGGGVSTLDNLNASHVLDTGVFESAKLKAKVLGTMPANLSLEKDPRMGYRRLIMFATSDALAGLRLDGAWINAQLMARARENGADRTNPLFTGSYAGKEYDSIVPYEFEVPRHDNAANGAIGSPLQPQALLRTATTSFSDTTTINGGGSSGSGTSILYFKHFPGYDFLFYADQSATTDTTTYYAKIIDMPGSANAGKFELISWVGSTGNNGNALTVTRGSATDGVSTNTTGVHAADSLIVPCNASGVEYANVIVGGAAMLCRAYGLHKERLIYQDEDYDFVHGVGVKAYFGQTPALRRDGVARNFVVAQVAIRNT